MYRVQLTIPKKIPDNYNLYVYRSKHENDVISVKACRKLDPIMKIDQKLAPVTIVDEVHSPSGDVLYNQEEFVLQDWEPYTPIPGVDYYGPLPSNIPQREFESTIETIFLNSFTFINYVKMVPLPLPSALVHGVKYFYSVIAVDDVSKMISNIITQNVTITYPEDSDVTYHVMACDDFNDDDSDIWTEIGTVPASDDGIYIGTSGSPLGSAVTENVPEILLSEVNASLTPLMTSHFMVLEVINPWQANNKRFNFRKLKSFKVISSSEGQFSDASEPTFQSLVPVSIEKMLIWMQTDPDHETMKTSFSSIDESADNCMKIIRKDGVYYNRHEHKKYGFNLWNIPSEARRFSVFAESSVQDKIKIQIPASTGHTYTFDIYLVDVYGRHNDGIHYIIKT